MTGSRAIAAWIMLSAMNFACVAAIQIEHNAIVWAWRGVTVVTTGAAIVYVVTLAGMLAIAPRTTGRGAVFTMWTVLVLLFLSALDTLRPEIVQSEPKPRTPSPVLYRTVLAASLSMPGVLVLLRRRGTRDRSAGRAEG